MKLVGKKILLIIGGGIAAYKTLDLIRRLREHGAAVRCVLTKGGAQFVTSLSLAALSEQRVYDDLFALDDDYGMSHIKLSRESDLLIVAPATANLMAKMAIGLADDLATTLLLASDKPVLIAPAMNVAMWSHPATANNLALLKDRGVLLVGPESGSLACGETGAGRMAEVPEIMLTINDFFARSQTLQGRHVIVTSGPTYEAIDPVRFLANRSSGRQGHAIAAAFQELGARVTLVTGPVSLPAPSGVEIIRVESAEQMLASVTAAMPADIAVCAAAVADWKIANPMTHKHKKTGNGQPPPLQFVPNPDILAILSSPGQQRPSIVAGFAAETEDLLANAKAKLTRKGCDIIFANDVSTGKGTFGGANNQLHLVTTDGIETWPVLSKEEAAKRLAAELVKRLKNPPLPSVSKRGNSTLSFLPL